MFFYVFNLYLKRILCAATECQDNFLDISAQGIGNDASRNLSKFL